MKLFKIYKSKKTHSPNSFAIDLSIEFKQLEKAYFNNEEIYFTVKKIMHKGVLAQIGSFSSFINYHFFFNKLQYYNQTFWNIISPNLVGKTFKGKIAFLNPSNFYIKIDSVNHTFDPMPLEPNVPYEGIVVSTNSRKTYIFIDIGYHFNYRYGIQICFIHRDQISEKDKFFQLKIGDTYPVYFQKYSQSGEILLADTYFVFSKYDNGTIEFFREPKQVSFVKMEMDYFNKDLTNLIFELWEDGNRIKIISPIMRKYYGRDKLQIIKDYFANVEAGQEFICKIVAFGYKARAYIGAVILDWIDSQETPDTK